MFLLSKYKWWLGTQAGNAIADVLFGDYNPSGKLPISFSRTEGQIPIYYNHYNTGRPARNDSDLNYVSACTDLPNSPKFPFGYGSSYTQFSYSDIKLNKTTITAKEKLTIKQPSPTQAMLIVKKRFNCISVIYLAVW